MNKITKNITIVATLTIMIFSFSGCTTFNNFKEAFFEEENTDTIKVGVYQPFTGQYKDEGEKEIRGIEIANQLYPEVLGKEVELLKVDTGSNLKFAETSLEQTIPKAPAAFLGSYGSTFSLLGSEYFQNAQIPAIAITNRNVYVTEGNPYYFRVSSVETRQIKALADFAVNNLKKTKVAILRQEKDDVADINGTIFDYSIEEYSQGKTTTKNVLYTAKDTDYTPYFENIKNEGIDTIFLQGDLKTAEAIIGQADNNAYEFNFMGKSEWGGSEFIEETKGTSVGVYFTDMSANVNQESKHYEAFEKAYKEKYPKEKNIPIEVYMAFDSYILLLDSIERAGDYVDGNKVKEAIAATKDFEGLAGIYNFDEEGDKKVDVKIMEIKSGVVSKVYTAVEGSEIKINIKEATEKTAEKDIKTEAEELDDKDSKNDKGEEDDKKELDENSSQSDDNTDEQDSSENS